MQSASPEPLTPTALAKAIGVSLPYASQILSGERPPKVPMAVRIFRATGHKLGPIADASAEEIDVLDRFQGAAA